MSDPGTTYRSRDEIDAVRKKRDPIDHLKATIIDHVSVTQREREHARCMRSAVLCCCHLSLSLSVCFSLVSLLLSSLSFSTLSLSSLPLSCCPRACALNPSAHAAAPLLTLPAAPSCTHIPGRG